MPSGYLAGANNEISMKTSVIIADDHAVMREGLRSLLARDTEFAIVGDTGDGRTAVELARSLEPDLVIMDIAMPGLNGIEATRRITSEVPGVKVIALSMHSERRFVIEVLKSGASGYLLKDCAFVELELALRTVISGNTYISFALANEIPADWDSTPEMIDNSAFFRLSSREREVLQLIAEGNTTRRIAEQLHISAKTADSHRQSIMKKLKIKSVANLTKYALRQGLTLLEKS